MSGTTVTVTDQALSATFNFSDTVIGGQAQTIAAAINAAAPAGVLFMQSASDASKVAASTSAIIDDLGVPVTLNGAGNEQVIGGSGGVTFFSATGTTTNIALSGGANTIVGAAGSTVNAYVEGQSLVDLSGNGTVIGGQGTSTIIGAGAAGTTSYFLIDASATNDVISAGAGSATVLDYGKNDLIFAGSGAGLIVDGGTNNTISGGSGSATIFGGNSDFVFFGSGATDFVGSTLANSGTETLVGNSGSETVFGGVSDLVFTNSSSLTFIGEAGNDTIDNNNNGKVTVFGEANTNITYFGNTGAEFVTSSGSETINASGSSGNNTFFLGSGNAFIDANPGSTVSGSASNVFYFQDQSTGGTGTTDYIKTGGVFIKSNNINGFALPATNVDEIDLVGYGANEVANFEATEIVSGFIDTYELSDGTKVIIDTSPACYVRGTHILTDRGEVAIERLNIGDLAVTACGALSPIVWIGHRALDLARHPDPLAVRPIRVSAGAFGEGLPRHDLWLSPGHNIACDETLIPISALINGVSVVQQDVTQIEYWHLELDAHDVIFAEGLPSESYLDTGNRTGFANGGAFVEAHPDFRPKHWADTCLPIALEGPTVAAVKMRLFARLAEQGCFINTQADAHVWIDGVRIDPMPLSETRLAFVLPPGGREIVLRSRTFIPAHTIAESNDPRTLGLCIAALQIDGAGVAIDQESACSSGWHEAEPEGGRFSHRWTTGETRLPEGARLVVIDLAGEGHFWNAPQNRCVVVA